MAGLPALHSGELGQVRKEAATAILCKCRGFGSPPYYYIVTQNQYVTRILALFLIVCSSFRSLSRAHRR